MRRYPHRFLGWKIFLGKCFRVLLSSECKVFVTFRDCTVNNFSEKYTITWSMLRFWLKLQKRFKIFVEIFLLVRYYQHSIPRWNHSNEYPCIMNKVLFGNTESSPPDFTTSVSQFLYLFYSLNRVPLLSTYLSISPMQDA